MVEKTGTEVISLTLDRLWQEFNQGDDARASLSRDDLSCLRRFVAWCGLNTTASSVSPYQIEDFLQQQLPSTTPPRVYLAPLKLFFSFAQSQGALVDNPMSRVRLPRGQGHIARDRARNPDEKVLLSKEKLDEFQDELIRLKEQVRPRILSDLYEARVDGDLRENAAFDDAKKQQGMVEGRIRELEQLIGKSELIEGKAHAGEEIVIGSLVELEVQDGGRRRQFRIVSPEETDPRNGKLSFQSPVGQAVMGARPKDIVDVDTPRGTTRYRIVAVS